MAGTKLLTHAPTLPVLLLAQQVCLPPTAHYTASCLENELRLNSVGWHRVAAPNHRRAAVSRARRAGCWPGTGCSVCRSTTPSRCTTGHRHCTGRSRSPPLLHCPLLLHRQGAATPGYRPPRASPPAHSPMGSGQQVKILDALPLPPAAMAAAQSATLAEVNTGRSWPARPCNVPPVACDEEHEPMITR